MKDPDTDTQTISDSRTRTSTTADFKTLHRSCSKLPDVARVTTSDQSLVPTDQDQKLKRHPSGQVSSAWPGSRTPSRPWTLRAMPRMHRLDPQDG